MKTKTKIMGSLALVMSLSSSAYAQSFHYYGGVLLGLNAVQNNKDLSVSQTKGPYSGKTFALLPQSTGNTDINYGLFAGVRKDFGRYFVGGELTLQDQTADATQTLTKTSATSSNDLKESLGMTAILAVVPGITLSPKWDIYSKLGYVMSQFHTSGNNPGNFGPKGDFSKAISGFDLGLGAMYRYNQHWTAALEYNYIHYSNFSITGTDDKDISGGAWGIVTANYKLSDNSLTLKGSYWF